MLVTLCDTPTPGLVINVNTLLESMCHNYLTRDLRQRQNSSAHLQPSAPAYASFRRDQSAALRIHDSSHFRAATVSGMDNVRPPAQHYHHPSRATHIGGTLQLHALGFDHPPLTQSHSRREHTAPHTQLHALPGADTQPRPTHPRDHSSLSHSEVTHSLPPQFPLSTSIPEAS